METRTKFEIGAGIFVAVVIAVMAWYLNVKTPAPVAVYEKAQTAPEVKYVPKVEYRVKLVKVYAPSAEKKLGVTLAPGQKVVAASKISPSLRSQTVVSTIDASGNIETQVRLDPYPWLAAEATGELRVDYGIKNGLQKAARISFSEDFIEVKQFHAGVNSSLDSDGAWFVGVGVGYKF